MFDRQLVVMANTHASHVWVGADIPLMRGKAPLVRGKSGYSLCSIQQLKVVCFFPGG